MTSRIDNHVEQALARLRWRFRKPPPPFEGKYPVDADALAELMTFDIAPTSYRRFVQDAGPAPDLGAGGNPLSPSPVNGPTQGVQVEALGSKAVEIEDGEFEGMRADASAVHDMDRGALFWLGLLDTPDNTGTIIAKRDNDAYYRISTNFPSNDAFQFSLYDGTTTKSVDAGVPENGVVIALLATFDVSASMTLHVWKGGSVDTSTNSISLGTISNTGLYTVGRGFAAAIGARVAADAVWPNPASLPTGKHLHRLMRGIGF